MEGNLFNLISPNLRNDKIRLHLPAIPHTITHIEYSHCAFTGKVLRFSPMMKSRGYEVFHYGVEGSESEADKDIIIMNKEEWKHLKLESFKKKYPNLSNDEYMKMLEDKSIMSGDLAHISNPLYIEFNFCDCTLIQFFKFAIFNGFVNGFNSPLIKTLFIFIIFIKIILI